MTTFTSIKIQLALSIIILLVLNGLSTTSNSGCSYMSEELKIQCTNASLKDLVSALDSFIAKGSSLTKVSIAKCKLSFLPPIFYKGNWSIEEVQITQSGLQTVHKEAFHPFKVSLQALNMSYNNLLYVPSAIKVLKLLNILDLSYNHILCLELNNSITQLSRLQELYLQNNFLGFQNNTFSGTNITSRNESADKKHDFTKLDFGKSSGSLKILNLGYNKLNEIPSILIQHPMPNLTHLDLRDNFLKELPVFSSEFLPKLKELYLQSNKIHQVLFQSLPSSIRTINLSDNPIVCDCKTQWLYGWQKSNQVNINLPTCKFPGESEVSPSNKCITSTPILNLENEDNFLKYEFEDVKSSSDHISITWKINSLDKERVRGWNIVYSKLTTPINLSQMVLNRGSVHILSTEDKQIVFTEQITNLEPNMTYVICLARVQDKKFIVHLAKCQEATTGQMQKYERAEARTLKAETIIDNINQSQRALTIKWKLVTKSAGEPVGIIVPVDQVRWIVKVRLTNEVNYMEFPVTNINEALNREGLYEYTVLGLNPSAHYEICLVDRGSDSFDYSKATEQVICEGTMTLAEDSLSTKDITIGAICSLVIVTTIMVMLLFFCPPKRKCNMAQTLRKCIMKCSTKKLETDCRIASIPLSQLTDGLQLQTKNNESIPPKTRYKNLLLRVSLYNSGNSEC